MKKTYLKPEIFSLNVFCDAMLAQSNGDKLPVVPGEGDEFANKHRGEWGNVWAN